MVGERINIVAMTVDHAKAIARWKYNDV